MAERGVAARGTASQCVALRCKAMGRSSTVSFRFWSGGGAGLIVTGGRWDCGAEQGTAVRCKAQLSFAPHGGAWR